MRPLPVELVKIRSDAGMALLSATDSLSGLSDFAFAISSFLFNPMIPAMSVPGGTQPTGDSVHSPGAIVPAEYATREVVCQMLCHECNCGY